MNEEKVKSLVLTVDSELIEYLNGKQNFLSLANAMRELIHETGALESIEETQKF